MNDKAKYKHGETLFPQHCNLEVCEAHGCPKLFEKWKKENRELIEENSDRKGYRNPIWLYKQRWIEGKGTKEIAKDCGCTSAPIQRWGKRFNIPPLPPGKRDSSLHFHYCYLYHLYSIDVKSQEEIGKVIGVSQTVIRDWFLKYQIETREAKETQRLKKAEKIVKPNDVNLFLKQDASDQLISLATIPSCKKYCNPDICQAYSCSKLVRRWIKNNKSLIQQHLHLPAYSNPLWLYKRYWLDAQNTPTTAKEMGVHPDTINKNLHRFNIPVFPENAIRSHRINQYCYLKKSHDVNKTSVNQIGRDNKVSDNIILNRFKKYNLTPRRPGLARHLASKHDLQVTPELQEYVDGSLLGDANVRSQNRCTGIFRQKGKHKEYITYVKNTLEKLGVKCSQVKRVKNDTQGLQCLYPTWDAPEYIQEWNFRTLSYEFFKEQAERWYIEVNGEQVKILPDDVLLTPISTTKWFLDDGSRHCSHEQIYLYTNCFTEKEVRRLADKLTQIGIPAQAKEHKENEWIIILNQKGYHALYDFIGETSFVDCYHYKFPRIESSLQLPFDLSAY